jgi:hypothetical protein
MLGNVWKALPVTMGYQQSELANVADVGWVGWHIPSIVERITIAVCLCFGGFVLEIGL